MASPCSTWGEKLNGNAPSRCTCVPCLRFVAWKGWIDVLAFLNVKNWSMVRSAYVIKSM